MMSNYTSGARCAQQSSMAVAMAACLLVFVSHSANAGSIFYGDFSDIPPGTVMYLDVTESSGTDPVPPAMYGAPTISGDLLDFDPTGFVASSMGGPLDVTDGQLNFTVMAAPGEGFSSIYVQEDGDYSFSGTGGAGTTVSASLSLRVEILEIDNVPLANSIVVTESDLFGDDYASAGGTDTGLLFWSLQAFADLSPVLGGSTLGVTKAEVAIDNQLITNSEADTLAFIAKKDFKIIPPPIIPEPASLALFGLGSLLICSRRR